MYQLISIKLFVMLPLLVFTNFDTSKTRLSDVYIHSYKNIAISEMRKTGIPASIKLAQGILESDLGRSDMAYKANNHFGIKCGKDWTGDIFFKSDDDVDSTGMSIQSCFRAYASAEQSYLAHSEFLTNPNKQSRYGFLFSLGSTDYIGWANGLKYAGYASDPTYPDKLIKIIEKNKLYDYDEQITLQKPKDIIAVEHVSPTKPTKSDPSTTKSNAPSFPSKKETPAPTKTYKTEEFRYKSAKINDVQMLYAKGGETVSQIANRHGMSASEIMEYNEIMDNPDYVLDKNEIVYLEKKKRALKDNHIAFHIVTSGQDMFVIAQKYGIRLESLLAKNNLTIDALPNGGEKISLVKSLSKNQTPKHKLREKFDSFVDLGGLK